MPINQPSPQEPNPDSKKLERREAVRHLLIERAHPEGSPVLSTDWRKPVVSESTRVFPRERDLNYLDSRRKRFRHIEPILARLAKISPPARDLLESYASDPSVPLNTTVTRIINELLDRIALELGDKLKLPRKWVPYPQPELAPAKSKAFWREEEAKGKSPSSGRRYEARKMFTAGSDVPSISRALNVTEKQILNYLTPEQKQAARLQRREKLCESCGKAFEPKRSDARSCSPACRQALARKAQKSCK